MSAFGRWLRQLVTTGPAPLTQSDELDSEVQQAAPRHSASPVLLDANTRTFWSRGATTPTTLVESDNLSDSVDTGRVDELLRSHASGRRSQADRPRANPAFAEAVFVELMRARRYQRAFELLTSECRRQWSGSEQFAEAQSLGALRHLQGVRVDQSRQLSDWRDPETGELHPYAAELDAEYTLDNGRRRQLVRRTVHLVGVEGRWMSLCYPPAGSGADAVGRRQSRG